jgi:hypothetical protein
MPETASATRPWAKAAEWVFEPLLTGASMVTVVRGPSRLAFPGNRPADLKGQHCEDAMLVARFQRVLLQRL